MTEQVVTPLTGEEPETIHVEQDLWTPFTAPLAEVMEANRIRWFATATDRYGVQTGSNVVISGPYVHFDTFPAQGNQWSGRVALHIEAIQGFGY